jgi:hypothetical protein
MEEFFTKDKANAGVEMPLYEPTGKKSDHSFRILGVDSDEYFKAETAMKRALPAIEAESKLLKTEEEKVAFVSEKQAEWRNRILSAVIAEWTFDKECNEANKLEFLTNAPQIAKAIDSFISDRRVFFSFGQTNLKNSQE